jgi:hypothetical protein
MKILIQLSGILHFLILIASALVPFKLDWKRHFAGLPPFLRTLFWVYGAFIVLMIITLGTLTLVNADAMTRGEPVARTINAAIFAFWGARLFVQLFIFDTREYLTNIWYKLGERMLTLAFILLTLINGWLTFFPGRNPFE